MKDFSPDSPGIPEGDGRVSRAGRPARPDLVPPGPEEARYPAEYVIAKTLHNRLLVEKLVREGESEAVAYRIAEIMVAAKDLYNVTLPRLTEDASVTASLLTSEGGAPDQLGFYEEIAGLRMALLHMRDLVSEFDAHFMDAMAIERADDESVPKWENPDDWSEEELEEEEP